MITNIFFVFLFFSPFQFNKAFGFSAVGFGEILNCINFLFQVQIVTIR